MIRTYKVATLEALLRKQSDLNVCLIGHRKVWEVEVGVPGSEGQMDEVQYSAPPMEDPFAALEFIHHIIDGTAPPPIMWKPPNLSLDLLRLVGARIWLYYEPPRGYFGGVLKLSSWHYTCFKGKEVQRDVSFSATALIPLLGCGFAQTYQHLSDDVIRVVRAQ